MIIENFKDDKEALRAMTGELVRYMDRKDDGLPFNLALSVGGTHRSSTQKKRIASQSILSLYSSTQRANIFCAVPPPDKARLKEYLPRHGQLPYFDCIILGIGGDAHTASIFPDTLPLLTDSRNYAVSQHPESHQFRITMTGPLILNDSPLLVPVLGTGKKEMLEELKKGYSATHPTPAAYILTHAVEAFVYTTL